MEWIGIGLGVLAIVFFGIAGIYANFIGQRSDDSTHRIFIRELAEQRGGGGYFVDGKRAGIGTDLCGENCEVNPCVMFDSKLPENQPTNQIEPNEINGKRLCPNCGNWHNRNDNFYCQTCEKSLRSFGMPDHIDGVGVFSRRLKGSE